MIEISFLPSDTTVNFLNRLSNRSGTTCINLFSFSTGTYIRMDSEKMTWNRCEEQVPGVNPTLERNISANYVNFELSTQIVHL